MKRVFIFKSAFSFCFLISTLTMLHVAQPRAEMIDSDFFKDRVATGQLPKLKNRLPDNPKIVHVRKMGRTPGQHGGTLKMAMRRGKDTRQMTVYGYARLVKYNEQLSLEADILENIDIIKDRIFRFKLREGHRWSDGHPFSIEDFRYWWENIANNPNLSPSGPPASLKVNGTFPKVTFPEKNIVQYEWPVSNPSFLGQLAQASPRYLYAPAHYLKQFHKDFQTQDKLDYFINLNGAKNWAALHNKKSKAYKNQNPELPTLQPWHLAHVKTGERYVFDRNPYFHRIDENGLQLPYIDQWVFRITEKKLIPLKAATGEVDLQARYLGFDNISLLKQNEKNYNFKTYLWRNGKGAHLALYPNLNNSDPVWRPILRDLRFRKALSLAINRYEINRVVYFGFAIEGQNTILPTSPLYQPKYREHLTEFDLKRANELLDEMGLTEKDGRGIRYLPDGRPLTIIIETADTGTEQSDVLQLIKDSWTNAGIDLKIKPTSMDILKPRIYAGSNIMTIFSGLENGMATANNAPTDLAPVNQDHFQWPKWGQYVQTGGQSGEVPDMPAAIGLMKYYHKWYRAESESQRQEIWHHMLEIHSEQLFNIGIIAGTLQPVVVSNRLQNVPVEAIWNWDPGAHFGVYNTDLFWFKG